MLRDEIAKYTELSGNDGEHTPIGIIGAYLDGFEKGLESRENKGEWIPITYRPMTDEEKEYYSEQAGCDKEDLDTMLNCQLPDDGEEVLITVFGEVETDIFYRDVDGCSFENRDIEDVTAWMPKPEPYKADMRGE